MLDSLEHLASHETPSGVAAEQHQLEALLRDSPACLASLSGSSHMITVTNKLFRELFGNRLLAGLQLRQALPELQDQPFFELLDEVYRTGTNWHGHKEVTFLDAINADPRGPVYFTFLAQAVQDAAGAVTGLLLFAYNVSAHVLAGQQAKAHNAQPASTIQQLALANEQLVNTNEELSVANEELATTNEQLRAANADIQAQAQNLSQLSARHELLDDTNQHLTRTNTDLDAFVYTASHDLQGPINNLGGLLHALREELSPSNQTGPVAHILDLMDDSVARFRHTLRDLTTIVEVQANSTQPAPLIPLADVVRNVLLDLALPIAEADAQLLVDVEECPMVAISEKNLRSVVYNLLSNAIKYRHPDRVLEIGVRCHTDAHHWILKVQDNGLGLDLTPGQPVFALFQRFHTHVDGSGIGLYMVKKLVENNGGRLEVTSELGSGSTFTVYLKR